MALQSSGAISLSQVNTELTKLSTATVSLNDSDVRTLAGIVSGTISMSDLYGKSFFIMPDKGIFAFGYNPTVGPPGGNSSTGVLSYNTISKSNIISNQGVVASDTSNVTATARNRAGGSGYGGDKAIVTFGNPDSSNALGTNRGNLISNLGIISADTTLVGTSRLEVKQAEYGGDKAIAISGFTISADRQNIIQYLRTYNLITNTGVVQSDSTASTGYLAPYGAYARVGIRYGGDKAFFYKQISTQPTNLTQATSYTYNINLVSNTGTIANDVTGVAPYRTEAASSGYGTDKAIIAYGGRWYDSGEWTSSTLISNTGTIVGDSNSLGTGRNGASGTTYGRDKAIIGYGLVLGAIQSLADAYKFTYVNNLGVLTSETSAVGTQRAYGNAAGIG